MGSGRSVYQAALGERFDELHPRLQRYFGPVPDGCVGAGPGVYQYAGSTRPLLSPLLRVLARRQILFPEHGRDVPFTVRNSSGPDGVLRARRTFDFPTRGRVMVDALSIEGGRMVDRLGTRGEFEVSLTPEIVDGRVRLTSGALALRVGRLRIPLPRIAVVTVDERPTASGQHVDVRVRAIWLGEIFRYSGSFTYDFEKAAATSS